MDLAAPYKTLCQEGVTIRLKRFDGLTQWHISTLGPKIHSISVKENRLENQPAIILKQPQGGPTVIDRGIRKEENTDFSVEETGTLVTNSTGSPSKSNTVNDDEPLSSRQKNAEPAMRPSTAHQTMSKNPAGWSPSCVVQPFRLLTVSVGGKQKTSLPRTLSRPKTQQGSPQSQDPDPSDDTTPYESSSSDSDHEGRSAIKAKANLLGSPGAAQVPADEISTAMGKICSVIPYLRSRVVVRAEIGRIFLIGMDPTALSFDKVTQKSKGWSKTKLLKELNANMTTSDKVRFTKIVSTRGSEMQYITNINNGGLRFWEADPQTTCVTYSFFCTSGAIKFVININSEQGSDYFCSICTPDTNLGADGTVPIYVHTLLCNWDLRVVLEHVDSSEAERTFGKFAKALLHSLSIS